MLRETLLSVTWNLGTMRWIMLLSELWVLKTAMGMLVCARKNVAVRLVGLLLTMVMPCLLLPVTVRVCSPGSMVATVLWVVPSPSV